MMVLSARHVEIITTLWERNQALANGNDDQRRELTRMIAEQCCFEFGPRWGTKAAAAGSPPSKDAIAYLLDNGRIDIWDWQNGSSRKPQVHAGKAADYPNEPQNFISVPPFNHLRSQPPPPPPPDPPAEDDVLKALVALKADIEEIGEHISAIETGIAALLAAPGTDIEPLLVRVQAIEDLLRQGGWPVEIRIPYLGTARGTIGGLR